ncbi:hypothetical protein D3C75_716230 [compost metagenome]
MHAQHREAEQRPRSGGHQRRQRQHGPEPEPQILVAERQTVGTNGVKSDVAEVQQAREPDHDIQPEAKQNVDQPEDRHRQHVFGGDKRKADSQGDNQRNNPAHPAFVFGRAHIHSRIIVIKARGHPVTHRGHQKGAE